MSTNPTVILITGPGGAGKSTTAERIAEEPGWVHLSEDEFWVRIKEGRPPGEERTADEQVVVQAQVVELMRELIASGNRVVLEFILYEDPPRPLLRYQEVLTDAGITFAIRVLRPSVDEVLRRQEQRGRPGDRRDRNDRRPGAERQRWVLRSSHIDRANVLDTTALSADEVFDLHFRPLIAGETPDGHSEVTDMILNVEDLREADGGAGEVRVEGCTPACTPDVLSVVARTQPSFLPYFESPPASTEVCAIRRGDDLVGAVLLETEPERAETATDSALACLVIDLELQGQHLGSAAIGAICQELRARGFDRVIAEWVASITLYERLGFRVWRTRSIRSATAIAERQ